VRVERVVLEHHRDVALFGREIVDDVAADTDLAIRDVFEARDSLECGRFATSRRSDEDKKLSLFEFNVQLIGGHDVAAVALPVHFGEILQH